MNLSEFKRQFKTFKAIEMIYCSFPNSLIGQKREIVQSNTVGFSLLTKREGKQARPSYMDWPYAKRFKMLSDDTFEFGHDDGTGNIDTFHYKIYK
jgi:hypothetical protein